MSDEEHQIPHVQLFVKVISIVLFHEIFKQTKNIFLNDNEN
jgi:hypothetical protein